MNQVELSPRMELNQRAKNAGYLLDSQPYYLLKKDHDIILCKDLLEVSQFLNQLEQVIAQRKLAAPDTSYVASLFAKGVNKIAQKVGEEAVEMVIESKDNNDLLFLDESADLLFHYLILLQAKGFELKDVVKVLEQRHKP